MSHTLPVTAVAPAAVTAASAPASGSAMCTRAPEATKARVMASPMPPAPPVTSTFWGVDAAWLMSAS